MGSNITLIALAGGLAIGLLVIVIGAAIVDRSGKSKFETNDDGVFSHFSERAFAVLFPDKTPEEVATDMGIKADEYYRNCRVAKEDPNLLALVMNVIYGITICLITFPLGILTNFAITVAGIFALLYIGYLPRTRLKNKANQYRAELADDLPRFLGLLKTELAIGLPIETAMLLIANKQDTRFAKEIQLISRKAELGASGWIEALEQLAADYDVETLKTFTMSISAAYAKGVSIADTIERASADIRDSHLLKIEGDAGRMTNYVILPVVLFQLGPIIAFMLIPVLFAMQAMNW